MGNKKYAIKVVKPEELDFEANWSSYLYSEKLGIKSDLLIRFSKIARLKRGIATGGNDFFVFTKEFAKRRRLTKYSREILASPKFSKGFSFSRLDMKALEDDGKPTLLLYSNEETPSSDELKSHLREGEKRGISKSYLCRNRNPWYKVDRREPPDAFLTYMGRKYPRFILNEADALYLNNSHGLYLRDGGDKKRKKSLLLFLNVFFSKNYLRRFSKRYSGGMFKIEPRDLEGALVLDYLSLSSEQAGRLAEAFDQLNRGLERSKAREIIKKVIS